MDLLAIHKSATAINSKRLTVPERLRSRYRISTDIRLWVQVGFAALCVRIGIEFHYFVKYLETGGISGSSYRPPGVEGFLPISSLMSLYHFFLSGDVHSAHPAGLFILLVVLIVSSVFGKSFCSWICPIGFTWTTTMEPGVVKTYFYKTEKR